MKLKELKEYIYKIEAPSIAGKSGGGEMCVCVGCFELWTVAAQTCVLELCRCLVAVQ